MPKEKTKPFCDACSSEDISNAANGFCVVCKEVMCESCKKFHRRQKISKDHKIITMDEYTNKPEIMIQSASDFHCDEHTRENLMFYCKDHQVPFCSTCAVINHKNCLHLMELNKNIASLLEEIDSNEITVKLKHCENVIKTFIKSNLTNLKHLKSQCEALVKEIGDLRKKLIYALDYLEKRVRKECNRIYQEDKNKLQERNKSFDSLLASIRNSSLLHEVINKYGSDTQKYLLTKKLKNQVSFYTTKCDEMCSHNEAVFLHLEINPKLTSVSTIPKGDIASLKMKRNDGKLDVTEGFKPLKDCKACFNGAVEIKGPDDEKTGFIDLVLLSESRIVLLDFANSRCCLVDIPSGQIISHYTLNQVPLSACLVGDQKVAISMRDTEKQKSILQLFSVADGLITPDKIITLERIVSSIAGVSQEEIAVSGPCDEDEYYWSVITLEGRETFYQEFDGHTGETGLSSMAFAGLKSRMYISVHDDNSLHCFGMDGTVLFNIKPEKLEGPTSVDIDRDGNVYVVGYNSDNVFQISPNGEVIQIITVGIPATPSRIRFSNDGDRFLIMNSEETNLLHQFDMR